MTWFLRYHQCAYGSFVPPLKQKKKWITFILFRKHHNYVIRALIIQQSLIVWKPMLLKVVLNKQCVVIFGVRDTITECLL